MTTTQFLAEWALRSSILILSGALLLQVLRIKDPSIRLACWTAMLCGSLAIPALTTILPGMPLAIPHAASRPAPGAIASGYALPAPAGEASQRSAEIARPFDWAAAGTAAYLLIAGMLLARLLAGLAMSRRLLRASCATGRMTEGIEIRESDGVGAPVTLGIARSVIVLPADWREWDRAKLEAVLAHERSHIRRNDPAVQLLSAIHRALVWHSPLSWFLHTRIVRVAEEASDDAAVAATRDRTSYAEVLLDFMQRGVRGTNWQGVAMARYGSPDQRIHRILDGTALSRGVTRWSVAAILALGSPLAYLAAAAHPQVEAIAPVADIAEAAGTAEAAAPIQSEAHAAAEAQQPADTRGSATIRRYMIFDGDSTSGSWDSRDPVDEHGLRAKFGQHFAWFRQAGNEYVITDSGVLAELRQAEEPQKNVNGMQSDVNAQQNRVNSLQADVNTQQSGVNAMQGRVNRRQDLINQLQSAKGDELVQKLEAALAELKANKEAAIDQATVNREQAKVNAAQSHVNEEQHKVNAEQAKVNEQQHRVSAEYNRRIQEIFDAAIQRHMVQQLM
jgi:beta-lactamase regulating signal transducer with metallopeptidase domain